MTRWFRVLFVLALMSSTGYVAAESARPTDLDGICLGPWECMEWCFERGCLTTTGCDTSTGGCFCANCQ